MQIEFEKLSQQVQTQMNAHRKMSSEEVELSFFFPQKEEPEFEKLEGMVLTIQRASEKFFPLKDQHFFEDLLLYGLDNAVRAVRAGIDPEQAVLKAFLELQQKHLEARQ